MTLSQIRLSLAAATALWSHIKTNLDDHVPDCMEEYCTDYTADSIMCGEYIDGTSTVHAEYGVGTYIQVHTYYEIVALSSNSPLPSTNRSHSHWLKQTFPLPPLPPDGSENCPNQGGVYVFTTILTVPTYSAVHKKYMHIE